MTHSFPAQQLTCPVPDECTVAISELSQHARDGNLPTFKLSKDRVWFRVYDARDGYGVPNPGWGNTRFAPFDDLLSGSRVPTMYLAESLEAALLETRLHTIYELEPESRIVAERSLHGYLHAQVVPPTNMTVVDLRDPQLQALGLTRENLANSSFEHYPCTRKVAQAVHAGPQGPDGIIWHSRQAEFSRQAQYEVMVVFADRVRHDRDAWTLSPARNANGALLEGAGRELFDEVADALGVTVIADY